MEGDVGHTAWVAKGCQWRCQGEAKTSSSKYVLFELWKQRVDWFISTRDDLWCESSPRPSFPQSYLETPWQMIGSQVGTKASIKYRPHHTIQIQYNASNTSFGFSNWPFCRSYWLATSYLRRGETNCLAMRGRPTVVTSFWATHLNLNLNLGM